MARSRNIKPGFFTNDELAELPALTRLLFIGLWTLADRDGRLEDRPKKIKAECMPYDDMDADEALSSLCRAGFITRYESDGVRCIQVNNWCKHQNPHVKESASTLPAPCEHHASTGQEPGSPQPEPARAGLIPDSGFLIPDSSPLIPDSFVGAATAAALPAFPAQQAKAPASDAKASAQRGSRLSKDWRLPKPWGEWAVSELRWPESAVRSEADKFRDYWTAKSGKDATKVDWEATWRNWCRNARVVPAASATHDADGYAERMAELTAQTAKLLGIANPLKANSDQQVIDA